MFFTKKRNKQVDAQHFLARIADQGTMNRLRRHEESRTELRTALSFGVWVIPLNGSTADTTDTFAALVKDVSSKGLSLITNREIKSAHVLVCFTSDNDTKFLRAKLTNSMDLGLEWRKIGMEVLEIVEKENYPELAELPNW